MNPNLLLLLLLLLLLIEENIITKKKRGNKREKKLGKLRGNKTNHSFYGWVLRVLWQFFLNFLFTILSFINLPSLCPPFNFKRFFPMWVCG
jgi:hypothetical protein